MIARKRGGNLKRIIITLLVLAGPVYAEMIPTGYNSWYYSEDPPRHAIEFGAEPTNFWDGHQWIPNDPSFEPCVGGFRSIKNRHYVFIDTINDIVRFSISDYKGNVHILKTRIGPMFLLNRVSSDTIFLASPNLSGYRLSGDSIEIPGVYPGVSCYIWNRHSGLDQQFVFSPAADTLIDRIWREAGSDTGIITINSIELFVDSLNLEPRDKKGLWRFRQSREIFGDIDLLTGNGINLLKMPQGWLEQGVRRAPLYRHIQGSGSRIRLCEGFRNSDIADWPLDGFYHNDSRTWQLSSVDTYVSALEPGSSFYSSIILTAHKDFLAGARKRALILFEGLIDSLQNATVIDSALLEVHYGGDLLGQGTLRLCRGIADSIWYSLGSATWNASYKVGLDSIQWAGGWGVHTSSYTTVNSVYRNLSDTSSTRFYQFPCREMMADIKTDGTDWGFWFDNGSGASTQRVSFDSGTKLIYSPRLYLEYRTASSRSRKLKMEE